MVTAVVVHAAYTFTTLAGEALVPGLSNGTGSAAQFNYPTGVAVDSAGTVYVADQYNCTIRKITSGGVVTTLAGTAGSAGATDGTGSGARFNFPIGVAVDGAGNVYVADRANHTIRKITSGGTVTTMAGTAGSTGTADGTGSAARFRFPTGVTVDAAGNVYVADRDNHTVRKITSGGVVTTLAGTAGSHNSTDGTGSAARFYFPTGVAVDDAGNLYVADQNNSTIRKITSGGVVTTLAGTAGSLGATDATGSAARFYFPTGVTVDGAGNVYVADRENHTIRKITSGGVVTTVAGTAGVPGATNGVDGATLFSFPFAVAVDSVGNLHVADTIGQTIRWGAQALPVSTGATTASGTVGQSFSYLVVFSGALTDYSASGLPAGLTFNPATDTISGVPSAAGTFPVALGATNGAGTGAATLTLTITGTTSGKSTQSISFTELVDRAFSTSPIALTATASSGLPVVLSVVSGPVRLKNGALSLRGGGPMVIRASQPGNASYLPASPVERSFTVSVDTTGIPAGFDVIGYLLRNADLGTFFGTDLYGAWQHYYNSGVNEGRVYDDLFLADEYLELYSDLKASFGTNRQAALMHWLNTGKAAGRLGRVPKHFDADAFVRRYSDLSAAYGSLPEAKRKVAVWNYYLDRGARAGRNDGEFIAADYLANHPDLKAAFGSDVMAAAVHWYVQGRYEGRRIPAFFSVTGYFTYNPDVADLFGADLYGGWLHYRDVGVLEGLVYNEEFRVDEYIAMYPDLQAAYGTDRRAALMHWLQEGRKEERAGRVPTAFDHAGYFTRNPDVAASLASLSPTQQRISGWTHYFYNGVREGRNFDALFRVNEYLSLYPDLQAAYGTKLGRVAFHWLIAGQLEGRRGRL